ncbi:MAG TPA: right-handed parallel beta-helix repeat-containing protein [Allosphingosinicella sp.]|nr:right-handed parallel beta-helix repeat-containing protein [Allosphingosinicella sp.]
MDRREFLATTGVAATFLAPAAAAAQSRPGESGARPAVLDIADFGIVAGDGDALAVANSAAVKRLLAHLLANDPAPGQPGTPAIKVTAPAGRFRFAEPWSVRCALWLEGQSNSQRFGYATWFDFDKGGFELHGPGTGNDGQAASASGYRIENLYCSSRAAVGTGHHGLHAVTRGDVIRCTFALFPGDGIRIESLTGLGASTNNANSTRILFCQSGGNGGSGIHLMNGDANCVTTQACDVHGNGEFGIFDNAFLSNHHIGHHAEGNGLGRAYPEHKAGVVGSCCTFPAPAWAAGAGIAVSSPHGTYRTNAGKLYHLLSAGAGAAADPPTHETSAGVVESDGYRWAYAGTTLFRRYHVAIGKTEAASTSAPGADPTVWIPFEFAHGPAQGIPLWTRGMRWKMGGSYCGNSPAGETVWEACYSEGSQPPAQIRSPQIWVGGQSPPSAWSTCVQVRSYFGALNNPNGFHAEKPAYNGQPLVAEFGTDLTNGRFMAVRHPTRHPNSFVGALDVDISFRLDEVGTFASFTGVNTAFTGGRSTAQPGAVNIPRLFVGSGASARAIDYGSGPPSSGHHAAGELVYNIAPAPGGKVGWVCTSAGTPGTWKAFGAIDP